MQQEFLLPFRSVGVKVRIRRLSSLLPLALLSAICACWFRGLAAVGLSGVALGVGSHGGRRESRHSAIGGVGRRLCVLRIFCGIGMDGGEGGDGGGRGSGVW